MFSLAVKKLKIITGGLSCSLSPFYQKGEIYEQPVIP
jgi:hypothetical protein